MADIIVTPGSPLVVTINPPTVSPVIITTATGPKGDTGDTGATGPAGPAGPAGSDGSDGADGADGKTYTISCVDGDNSDEEKIRLTDNDGTTDDVVLEAGTGMSIARSGDKITLTNTVTDTNLGNTDQTLAAARDVELGGNNLTFSNSDTVVHTISPTTGVTFNRGINVTGTASSGASITLREDTDNGTNGVSLQAPSALGGNLSLILPSADGSDGHFLKTDGAGNLSFAASSAGLSNVVEDTTPQLGGNLDLNSNNITGTGNIDTTGTLGLTTTTTDDSLLITTTEDGSDAAPVITLKRNSSSPDDGDYLGQLKFKGENDADQEVVYAKITAKISDVTDTTEDGVLEFALRKAGSNSIGARLTSTKLRLINGTGLEVGGYDFPTTDGSANQVLGTDGAGTLTFVTRATEAYVNTAANTLTENTQTGTTYTTVLTDAGKMITCDNASAITITIPRNSIVAYEAGTVLSFIQKGAGQVTLVGMSGVVLNNANGLKTASQYSVISCWKEDTDTWVVYGDTTS